MSDRTEHVGTVRRVRRFHDRQGAAERYREFEEATGLVDVEHRSERAPR